MFTPLIGPRLILRPFGTDDITDTYINWLNEPQVVRYSNQRFHIHHRESCEAYFRSFENSANLFISICVKGSNCAVGTMTVYRNNHHATADVGIMVGASAARGKGYGLEAWQLLTDWLLTEGGVRKITAGTLACNKSMVRLAEQSGMLLEGVRKNQEIVDGSPEDILYFGRFRE